MYSVKFDVKNGKKYYAASNGKYHLEDEDMVLGEIPAPLDDSKMYYYYYQNGEWVFDSDAYEQAKQQEIEPPTTQEVITSEELLAAILEIAENVSDLEDAVV